MRASGRNFLPVTNSIVRYRGLTTPQIFQGRVIPGKYIMQADNLLKRHILGFQTKIGHRKFDLTIRCTDNYNYSNMNSCIRDNGAILVSEEALHEHGGKTKHSRGCARGVVELRKAEPLFQFIDRFPVGLIAENYRWAPFPDEEIKEWWIEQYPEWNQGHKLRIFTDAENIAKLRGLATRLNLNWKDWRR